MVIDGNTELIAHIGYPTYAFRAPLIYNPWFASVGINAIVVPMACQSDHYPAFLPAVFGLGNVRGALITMPHKVITVGLLDEVLPAAAIAGACNAVRRLPNGKLQGDMFDGEGFVRGLARKGFAVRGCRALVVGAGGVGSAIAASLAAAGARALSLFDVQDDAAPALARRLAQHYPALELQVGSRQPQGHDLLVNATPLGMKDGDPLPFALDGVPATTFVGEVVMKTDMTPLLRAAQARGCTIQIGSDMLYEQIPAYLEFFGYPAPMPEELRRVSAAAVAAHQAAAASRTPAPEAALAVEA